VVTETGIVHHIAGFRADGAGFDGVAEFIEDEPGKEGLAGHD
jgi:hypothetical protein